MHSCTSNNYWVHFVGEKLAKMSPQVAEYLSPKAVFNKHKTCIVHGDYKSANIFIKSKDSDDVSRNIEVSAIDFQWTGPGLASTDLIYFLSMCLPGEYLYSTDFLQKYWDYFKAATEREVLDYENNTCSSLTIEEFKIDFKIALLDFTRWAFCARLKVFICLYTLCPS